MRAETGKTYAQIVDGKCHWLFTANELPEWNNKQCPAVDVTGAVPSVGDSWSGTAFVPPVPPTQDEIDATAAIAAAVAAKAEAVAENKGHATIQYLTTHTPAQIAAYIGSNVTDLASAKVVITRLAVAIGALLR